MINLSLDNVRAKLRIIEFDKNKQVKLETLRLQNGTNLLPYKTQKGTDYYMVALNFRGPGKFCVEDFSLKTRLITTYRDKR